MPIPHLHRSAPLFIAFLSAFAFTQSLLAQPSAPKAHVDNASFKSNAYKNSPLFIHTAAVFVPSQSQLDQFIAASLFKSLQSSDRFKQLTLYSGDSIPPLGGPLPDVTITIRTDKATWSPSTFTANVQVSVDNKMLHAPYMDDLNVLPVMFDSQDIISFTTPIAPNQAAQQRDEKIAADIAAQAILRIDNVLDRHLKNRPINTVPAPEFLPAYTATPSFSFLNAYNARMLATGTTFMKSNVTTWWIQNQPPDKKLISQAIADAQALGWKVSDKNYSSDTTTLYAHSGVGTLETLVLTWANGPLIPPGYDRSTDICQITYMRRMTPEQIADALKTMLARGPSDQELLTYKAFWGPHKDALAKLFAARPPQSLPILLDIIDQHIKAKETDLAKKAILRADALQRLELGQSPSDLADRAKSLGLTLPKIPAIDALAPSECFLASDLPATRIVPLGCSIFILRQSQPDKVRIDRITPVRTTANLYAFKTLRLTFEPGKAVIGGETAGDASGQSGPLKLQLRENDTPITVQSRLIPGTQNFQLQFN